MKREKTEVGAGYAAEEKAGWNKTGAENAGTSENNVLSSSLVESQQSGAYQLYVSVPPQENGGKKEADKRSSERREPIVHFNAKKNQEDNNKKSFGIGKYVKNLTIE